MKNVNSQHNRAMDLAEQAIVADFNGDREEALKLFTEAFKLERKAALTVHNADGPEPTRSVLLRSAASLAIDCEQLREAERLISLGLVGDPPEEICEELRDLLETVNFSRHLSLKGLRLDIAEMQMSLDGAAVGNGIIDGSEFLQRAQTAETMLVRTAERLFHKPFRESRKASLAREFHPYFSVPRAASFAVTIRIGRPNQQTMLPGFPDPKQVIEEVLSCLDDFKSDKVGKLEERISSESYFNNFVALARKLSPDGERIKMVGFSVTRGKKEKKTVLTKPAGAHWRPKSTEPSEPREPPPERIVGWFKGADDTTGKKSHWFKVEEVGGSSQIIYVPPGLLDDIVKPMWGERVAVMASRKKGDLQFLDFDTLSAAEESAVG